MYTSVAERGKRNRSKSGIGRACLHETWTRSVLGPFLKSTHIVPGKWTTSYRFQEVPCERKAYLDPIWDWSQIYPVPCKRGLNFCLHKKKYLQEISQIVSLKKCKKCLFVLQFQQIKVWEIEVLGKIFAD